MRRKRFIYWVILIVLLSINVFILIHRNDGFKYFPYKSYSQLYVTDSTLYLKDLHFDADTLQLFFSLKLPFNKYKLIVDDSISGGSATSENSSIRFALKRDFHQYKLMGSNNETEIIIQADHSKVSADDFINEFIYCNLPGPQIKVSCYNIWTKGTESFTAEELKSGADFLKSNTKALLANTDSAGLMEVCKLISTLRPNPHGIKAEEASALSPYRQSQLAIKNKVNLNCGNYSAMLYFFCSILHLPNRVVTFSGPAGNWRYGVHYYNEVYLREKQQWVLCDGLTNIYMPHDSVRFYNAADINQMAHLNSFHDKYVYTFKGSILKEVRYDSLNYLHLYYNRNNAGLRYLYPGNHSGDGKWIYLKEFYSFSRNFDLYSVINENDWKKVTIKMIAFYLMLVILVLYIWYEMKTFFN